MAYIDAYDVIVTRKKIYIDRYTPILTLEEYEVTEDTDVIVVTRMGRGLTEDDFELDFTHYAGVLDMEAAATDLRIEKEGEIYIVFSNFELETMHEEPSDQNPGKELDYSKMSIAELKVKMQEAADAQNYPKAGELRDMISEKEKKREKRHHNKN